nr:hypothetical protein [Halomonas sp. LBP4]
MLAPFIAGRREVLADTYSALLALVIAQGLQRLVHLHQRIVHGGVAVGEQQDALFRLMEQELGDDRGRGVGLAGTGRADQQGVAAVGQF